MTNNKGYEEAFKRRYNRTVSINSNTERNSMGTPICHTVEVFSKNGTKYTLVEHLENGLTKCALVEHNDKSHKFHSYLLAEVYVADAIGEEEYGNNN